MSQKNELKEEVIATLRKAEKGILNQVTTKMPEMLRRYFYDLARTKYGSLFVSASTEDSQDGLESIMIALIQKTQEQPSCLGSKAQRSAIEAQIQAKVMEEVATELESFQLQMTGIRKDVQAIKKKKKDPGAKDGTEFSFDNNDALMMDSMASSSRLGHTELLKMQDEIKTLRQEVMEMKVPERLVASQQSDYQNVHHQAMLSVLSSKDDFSHLKRSLE